jgi:chitinase
MKSMNAEAITSSYSTVEKYLAKLVDGYTTPAQREAAKRGTADTDVLKGPTEKTDALQADWTNPF